MSLDYIHSLCRHSFQPSQHCHLKHWMDSIPQSQIGILQCLSPCCRNHFQAMDLLSGLKIIHYDLIINFEAHYMCLL